MIYDYSKLSILELIKKVQKTRFFDLPSILAEVLKKLNNKSVPYKVYTAQLLGSPLFSGTQKINILENTIGGDIIWSRVSTGVYKGILPFNVDLNKVSLKITEVVKADDGENIRCYNHITMSGLNEITITSFNSGVTDYFPDISGVGNNIIEVKIYE